MKTPTTLIFSTCLLSEPFRNCQLSEPAVEIQPESISQAIFVTGSTLRHVIRMTLAGAIGLVSVFAVDVLNLFYISTLGDQALTAAVGYAATIMFFTVSISIGFTISSTALVSRALETGNLEAARIKAGALLIYIVSVKGLFALVLYPILPSNRDAAGYERKDP